MGSAMNDLDTCTADPNGAGGGALGPLAGFAGQHTKKT